MGKTTQLSDGTNFKAILSSFIDYLCNQYISVPMMYSKLQGWYDESVNAYKSYVERIGINTTKGSEIESIKVTSETESQKYNVPFEHIIEYDAHLRTVESVYFIHKQFLETQFVDLISRFDIFLQSIIRKVYYLYPDRLNGKEKKMLFEKISSLNSIDEFKKSFIEDILDTLFRGSHYDQLDYLKDELEFDVKVHAKDVYVDFIELTERRNVLIHANGIIGDQYVNVCKERGATAYGTKGQKLEIDIDYFKKSCDELLKLAVVIGYWFWTTRAKDERQRADEYIINVANRLIRDKRSGVAVAIIAYVLSQEKSKSKAIYLKKFKLYQLYALKDLGNIEQLTAGLGEDWSDVNNSIKLKLLVLENNYEGAIKLFKKIRGNEEGVNKTIFSESVIYREFIQEQEFRNAYKEVYGEPFCCCRDSLTE